MHAPHVKSGGRYPVLRALAIMYVLVAALTVLGSIAFAIYAMVRYNLAWNDRLTILGATLVGGFVAVLSMLAVAELIKLFIDLEHNTRMAIPGRMGMAASVTTTPIERADGAVMAPANAGAQGSMAHVNRLDAIDEETAEGALLRGH